MTVAWRGSRSNAGLLPVQAQEQGRIVERHQVIGTELAAQRQESAHSTLWSPVTPSRYVCADRPQEGGK